MTSADPFDSPRAVLDHIVATFGRDFEVWKQVLDFPFVLIGGDSRFEVHHDTTEEDFPWFPQLRRQGFDRLQLDRSSIRLVTESTALVDASYRRLRTDGSVLDEVGGLYVCRCVAGGWRAAAAIGHPYDEPIVT